MASLTGVRDTPKRRAISDSSSAMPGGSRPRTISSAICKRSFSERVGRGTALTVSTGDAGSPPVELANVGLAFLAAGFTRKAREGLLMASCLPVSPAYQALFNQERSHV